MMVIPAKKVTFVVGVIAIDWLQIESNLRLGQEFFLMCTFHIYFFHLGSSMYNNCMTIHHYLQGYLELEINSHSN